MIIRRANTRGIAKTRWIESRRTFSNNQYWNPKYMNWGPVKVINDDILEPGYTVPNHQHKHYDILGYLVEGTLEHCDSLGNTVLASYPQIQHMSCGPGIWHTEKCVSNIPARYLQIWITTLEERRQKYATYNVITRYPEYSLLDIDLKQDIEIFCGNFAGDDKWVLGKECYLYVVSGTININDQTLNEGDGAILPVNTYIIHGQSHIIRFQHK
jgi:redox-sensitive bicupin YhaK (pirin superfamily)